MRLFATLLILIATPALAHPGDHAGLAISALAAHLFETDHIIFAMLAGVIGVLAYRAGRRAEARMQKSNVQAGRHDPR